MDFCFRHLGIGYEHFPAADEQHLTQGTNIFPVKLIFGNRSCNPWRSGLFLSHYRIWEGMDENDVYLVLEDDIRFGTNFVRDLQILMKKAAKIETGWDLIYLGRKRGVHLSTSKKWSQTQYPQSHTVKFTIIYHLLHIKCMHIDVLKCMRYRIELGLAFVIQSLNKGL